MTFTNAASPTIDHLAALTHTLLAPLADPSRGYALLDFPDYSNIGDSLIWLGELAYFKKHVGRQADYVCTTGGFDPATLFARAPTGPVYLSGGGNFGDIWPRFQQFRLHALETLRGRRIVQLPQTILFRDDAGIRATRDAIRAHGNFVMMVRDQRSFRIASEQLECETVLAPDMAFCMGALAAPAPRHDLTYLVRKDQESAVDRDAVRLPADTTGHITDWLAWPPPGRAKQLAMRVAKRLDPRSLHDQFLATALSERARGVDLLGSGRVVVTDRLHGHILSLLMGRHHVVVDNNYGKIGGIMDAWTGTDPLVHRAADFAAAGAMAADLVRRK